MYRNKGTIPFLVMKLASKLRRSDKQQPAKRFKNDLRHFYTTTKSYRLDSSRADLHGFPCRAVLPLGVTVHGTGSRPMTPIAPSPAAPRGADQHIMTE